ncbi:MAG: alpha-hydroxy-acid oxidizing protein [Shimia sp.]|nr:alpha-hydroxy-acid oxidizing protein [Shimia sp.]
MDLHAQYPALCDLRDRAQKRLPKFVWEYLDSATGEERTKARNRLKLNEILFEPSILHGELSFDLTTSLFGKAYDMPVGIAPVGMSGLIWPGAEKTLAAAGVAKSIPYTLSTVATQTPEDLAPHIGQNGWFQLYPPRDEGIRQHLLQRVKNAGFSTLVLTVDVPTASRRERQVRSGLTAPPTLTPRLLAQVAARPAWALATAQSGMPRMKLIDDYSGQGSGMSSTAHAGYLLRTSPNWGYVQWLRDAWDGNFVVKGVLRAADSVRLASMGVDALWLSSHAGRQFDAAPAPIEVLPRIREATDLPLIVDSGFESGLDILRALALGANFVMMGRPFHFALAALGQKGPAHLVDILKQDLKANMGQLGLADVTEVPSKLRPF